MGDVYSVIKSDHTRGYPYGGTTGKARGAPASMGFDEECRHPYSGRRTTKSNIVNPRKDEINRRIKNLKKIYKKIYELLEIASDETFAIDETLRTLYRAGCGYAKRNQKSVDKIRELFGGLQPEMMWENEMVKEALNYKPEERAKKEDEENIQNSVQHQQVSIDGAD
jgi:hypothetical protein